MNDINKPKYLRLGKLTNFPFIEQVFDALTYYELLCKVVEYLNKIVTSQNQVVDAVTELQDLYTELKDYVDNYFTNLDVQEQINNKLDEMAESGQLTEIVTAYLQIAGVLAFDTVDDMKNSDNLIAGSFVKTFGYHTLNDGGGATYKIRPITSDDLDEMFLIAVKDTSLVAELIYDEINVKQIGAYGDGTHDDTLMFTKACSIQNSVIYVPRGTYLITSIIKMSVGVKLKGTKNSIITTNNTSLPLLYINRYCDIKDMSFTLPKGYFVGALEIGFKTLSPTGGLYNNANIHINNINFLFDLDINTLSNKTGDCFKITADNQDTDKIYDGTGFWGIYIDNIFVKGACRSVINQYTETLTYWITSCYYNNFNIDSAPLYGFLGVKDVTNPSTDYYDGEVIYFNNWAMQCGNSHNMFYFSAGYKYVTNCIPWDWSYAVSPSDKPFALLYRPLADYSKKIYVDRQLFDQYNYTQIINLPSNVNFWAYVDMRYSNWQNENVPVANPYYHGKWKTLTKNEVQNIPANTYTEVVFEVDGGDNGNLGLTKSGNGILVGDGISGVLINIKLNTYLPNGVGILAIYKNSSQVSQFTFAQGTQYCQETNLINVTKGDIITLQFYCDGGVGSISQLGEIFNYLKVMPVM